MIYFLATRGFADCVSAIGENPAAPKITVLIYDDVLQRLSLPRGTYVFTDIDRLSSGDLIRAARLYRRLAEGGCRVLNDPAEVKTRFALLRALHDAGENPINAYRVDEGVAPRRFPVFVRVADDHLDPLTDLIHDEATLARAIKAAVASGIPRSALIVIEYAAEPVRPGLYRKLSVFRLGDRYLPHVSVHDVSWQVKHGRLGVASGDLYDEELAMMRSNPYARQAEARLRDRRHRVWPRRFWHRRRRCLRLRDQHQPVHRTHPAAPLPAAGRSDDPVVVEADRGAGGVGSGGDRQRRGRSEGSQRRRARARTGIFPTLADGHTRLSREYEKRGNVGAALAAAEQAVATNPNDISALSQKAKLLADSKRTEEAIAIGRKMMGLDPNRARTCYFLAGLLAKTGRPEEALAMARAAAELEPKNWRFQLRLSRMSKTAGNLAEARAAAERAFESAPEEAKVKEQLRALGHETPPRPTTSTTWASVERRA